MFYRLRSRLPYNRLDLIDRIMELTITGICGLAAIYCLVQLGL